MWFNAQAGLRKSAQSLSSLAMIELRDFVFPVFICCVLPQCIDSAAAQATHDVRSIRFEKTFLSCSDVGNGAAATNTQFNVFFVAHPVLYHLGYKDKGGGVGWINLPKDIESSVKSGVLDQAKHGKVELRDERNERTHEYFYLPNSDGYVGKDRVAFWVEVLGRRYKVVYNLAVIEDEDPENSPQCERMRF